MPVFDYSEYDRDLRNIVCSNPILDAVPTVSSRCNISNFLDERFAQSPTFPHIRNNSAYAMDVDSVCNILEGIAQNTISSDAAVRAAECISRDDRIINIASSLTSHNILEGMTQNAVCGDAAVMQDRPIRRMSRAAFLRKLQGKLEEDYRRWEVERIKRLISSKATVRYIIEVK